MKKVFIFLIKGYQKLISPMFKPSCRYYPSCSQYSVDAISKFGVIKGIVKSVLRILRCNPFSKGGYDPVE